MYFDSDVPIMICISGDCSCSEFLTEDGYGNCKKPTKNEPEKGPFCYVNIPSTCSDVIDEDSKAQTGYSWEACNNSRGKILACTNVVIHLFLSSLSFDKLSNCF